MAHMENLAKKILMLIQAMMNMVKTGWHTFISSSVWRWLQKATALVLFSLVINHLAASDNFFEGKSYRFPLEGFLFTIIFYFVIGGISDLNFKYYKNKHFCIKVETATVLWFVISTLGYIAIIYIPINIILEIFAGGFIHYYYIGIGLILTLLVSLLYIGLWYAQDIYDLHKISIKNAEITIDHGAKITKLTYENIACFYSENKIVYTVQNDGTTIITNFTLNELEEKINDQLFFRANRQIIVHRDAVDQIERIENGKLRIRLKALKKNELLTEITISRYKRKTFLAWVQ